MALALTLGLAVFIISALALIFFGENIGSRMATYFGFSSTFETAWALAHWPIVVGLTLLGVELIHYFARTSGGAKTENGGSGSRPAQSSRSAYGC